ncbi:hypothetical protein CC85DRAFT_287015 [Cutaneotrichosporon oleaginosum]|uniref:Uncharacterized protein n=1 Tax=Cutaneotrichosporon oleaginosum TaxID=879819 RepID=A0A0J1AZU3_9TREE|nr:uncharacterized protein CC85DRAFT_287015 [Cutaneotrichosporon oleaginosum]KLT40869.1 hypothetical protein CC85DRAFT_287015 [Cutaneotrichosporon oleaginosum]TXT09271.1 hypothetical protein COLE_03205 [Cutaneotrichosporon oleaginosum]
MRRRGHLSGRWWRPSPSTLTSRLRAAESAPQSVIDGQLMTGVHHRCVVSGPQTISSL